ncbi:hypothetical protein ABZ604_31615 [Streptomyces sp. NPDC012473]|uniref:hypothetical protein n=1 Tax=Streptomyces sp. NPDC012473 TaxID=3156676 RepID=UPI0033F40CD2
MATTKSHRDIVRAHGQEMFMRIALEMGAGKHLLSCTMEMAPGVLVPARALIEVSEDLVSVALDHSQVSTFATVLGAGLMNAAVEVCQVTARSTCRYGFPIERVWEKDMGTGLAALTADEAKARCASDAAPGTSFRNAFDLDIHSGVVLV